MNNQGTIKQITISVKDLVAFVMQSGSIDYRFGGFNRAQEGTRIHHRIQKKSGKEYQSEVSLQYDVQYKDIYFSIKGRADGIIKNDDCVIIDEIKTISKSLELIHQDSYPDYWAQAQCYAFMICEQQLLKKVMVQLTYYQIESKKIKRLQRYFNSEQLHQFFFHLLEQLYCWQMKRISFEKERNQSVQKMEFPFDQFRKGQREMAIAVYKTIRNKNTLFCQAPTGIGKTISVLYAAIQSIGQGMGNRIFYSTAKSTNCINVEYAINRLRDSHLKIKSLTLTAKEKTCFLKESNCNPEDCPYANDYYSRVKPIMMEMLDTIDCFDKNVIQKWAKEKTLCPFELSLDLAQWVDIVIGDYNYLFDPIIRMERLFSKAERKQWIVLIDEAHNLVDRARGMYSQSIHKSDFLALKRRLPSSEQAFKKAVDQVNRFLIDLRKSRKETYWVTKEALNSFNECLLYYCFACEKYIKTHKTDDTIQTVLDLYYSVRHYLDLASFYDKGSVTTVNVYKSEVTVAQKCLDPSEKIIERTQQNLSTIFFSATLLPMNYYIELLGGSIKTPKIQLPSPFNEKNFEIIIANHISTKYAKREESMDEIIEMIETFVNVKSGHYIVFFPSYAYLEATYTLYQEIYPKRTIIVQNKKMNDNEKMIFLDRFSDYQNDSDLLGFCVLGGFFGEGIDLVGDRLIGVVIVGVGLPKMGKDVDLLKNYYDQKRGMGFDFAYRFPGMNKVLQAMGRVIRSRSDKGMALLIDERFGYSSYQNLFPMNYSNQEFVQNNNELREKVDLFWNKQISVKNV